MTMVKERSRLVRLELVASGYSELVDKKDQCTD